MQNLKVDSLARFLLFLSLLHSLQYVKKFFGLKPTSLMEKFLKKNEKKICGNEREIYKIL